MRLNIIAGTLLISSCIPAFSASFSEMVVFGDSLSDTGNVALATANQFPGSNYAPGRFTDGATTTPATSGPFGIWVDQLATRLGVPDPQPFLAGGGGTDYAFGSATTGSNGLYNITDQVNLFRAGNLLGGASSTALYTIWGGSNDLLFGGNTPTAAADSLASNIRTLAGAGARNFLWFNLPPLGDTPYVASINASGTLNAAALDFKNQWALDLAALQSEGIAVTGVEIYGLVSSLASNPASVGFTNVTTPAQGVVGVNPNDYLFWDTVHPTTAGHALVADLAYNDLNATPEPMSVGISLLGLCVLGLAARSRKFR